MNIYIPRSNIDMLAVSDFCHTFLPRYLYVGTTANQCYQMLLGNVGILFDVSIHLMMYLIYQVFNCNISICCVSHLRILSPRLPPSLNSFLMTTNLLMILSI